MKNEKNCPCKAKKEVTDFKAFNESMSNANKIPLSADALKSKKKKI